MKRCVDSSNGELVIEDDGAVLVEESVYDGDQLVDIVKFDLDEYRKTYPNDPDPGSYDILDLGYWMKDGRYEPPAEDWRREFRGGETRVSHAELMREDYQKALRSQADINGLWEGQDGR